MTVDRIPSRRQAALAGVLSAAAGAGVGELVTPLVAPEASPFGSVGAVVIDTAPGWAKDLAVSLFWTADKIALLVGIGLLLLGIGALAGLAERRVPWTGRGIAALMGIAGIVAALSRDNAHSLAWLPSLASGAAAMLLLSILVPAAVDRRDSTEARRRFLGWSIAAAGIAVVGSAVAAGARVGARAAEAVREKLHLPTPQERAVVPADAELGIDGLSTVVTANDDFYRIDTALVVPEIDPQEWSLRIHGMVEHEITITWDELISLPLQESVVTLSCVSNPVGGSLVGNAVWLGLPIREVLARAQPLADADMVLSRSHDGFTASTPIEALTDDRDALLAVGMNGEPLPYDHGFPVRMVVPGLYGYVSATKWVVELEVTRFDTDRAYWTDRGWSERGPIKLQSRIDVPRARAVPSGRQMIAGVAWQPHTGIEAVEVQIDDHPWQQADLATAISTDTWVQWSLPWDADAGDHVIRCRAVSRDGERQTDIAAPVVPDGAQGWHEVTVTVR